MWVRQIFQLKLIISGIKTVTIIIYRTNKNDAWLSVQEHLVYNTVTSTVYVKFEIFKIYFYTTKSQRIYGVKLCNEFNTSLKNEQL